MSDRLSRKDIKQPDAFTEGVGTAIEYVESNHRLIATIFGVALALGLFVVGVITWLERSERKANEQLAAAIRIADAEIDAISPKPDDPARPTFASEAARRAAAKVAFEKLAGMGGDASSTAHLYLAQYAMEDGDAAKARQLWQDYLDDHGDALPAAGVELSLIALDRADGKGEELAARLREAIGKAGNRLPDDVLLFQLATTLDALGKGEEARQAYQRLIDEFPQSNYTNQARQAIIGRR
jgi:tetratricopeptide (TPR) repeat protein